jgi:hypothetical protein
MQFIRFKKQEIMRLFILAVLICIVSFAKAQCTWHTQLIDSFEYQTPCPDVLTGTVYTTIPQTWTAHSGTRSLYLNFVNCTGTTGTCAGDTVYKRVMNVCPNLEVRISSWLTTTFSGPQCDVKFVILDANNAVLDSTHSIVPAYSPAWTQYQSANFTPSTSSITVVLITNVGGGNGNDLSMDDLMMENCFSFNLGNDTTLCNSNTVTLDAGNGYASYLWNNGSTNQTLTAFTTDTSGAVVLTYIVVATDSSGCQFTDTIRVIFITCTMIGTIADQLQLQLYPDPAESYVNIISNEFFKNETIEFFDVTGRCKLKVKLADQKQIVQLSGLNSGVYFYRIKNSRNKTFSGKLMISRH